jgi:hypothetical protein
METMLLPTANDIQTIFKILSQNLRKTEENHKTPHSGYLISGPRYKSYMNKTWAPLRGQKLRYQINNCCEDQNEIESTSERRYTKENKKSVNTDTRRVLMAADRRRVVIRLPTAMDM